MINTSTLILWNLFRAYTGYFKVSYFCKYTLKAFEQSNIWSPLEGIEKERKNPGLADKTLKWSVEGPSRQ